MAHLKYHDVELHDAVRDEAVPQFVALITRRKKDLDDRKAQEDQVRFPTLSTHCPPFAFRVASGGKQPAGEQWQEESSDSSDRCFLIGIGAIPATFAHLS